MPLKGQCSLDRGSWPPLPCSIHLMKDGFQSVDNTLIPHRCVVDAFLHCLLLRLLADAGKLLNVVSTGPLSVLGRCQH